MATLVDALVVSINLDTSGLRRGRQEAEDSFAQLAESFRRQGLGIETTARSVVFGLDTIRLGYLAMAAVAIEALKAVNEFANQAAQNAGLARHAETVRKTVEEYDLWRQTLENFTKGGGSQLDKLSDTITQGIEQFKLTGQWPEQFNYLRALHISPKDPATGGWKDWLQILKEVAAALQKMPAEEAKAWAAGNNISFDVLAFFRQGPEKVREQLEETRRIGVLTKEQAQASQEIYTAWSQTQQAIRNLVNTELVQFKTGIKEILQSIQDITKEVTHWVELIDKIPFLRDFDIGKTATNLGAPNALTWVDKGVNWLFGPGASSSNLGGIGKWLDDHLGTNIEKGGTASSPAVDEFLKSSSGAIDRSRFTDEVKNNPSLFYKAADMVAGEVGKTAPVDTQRAQLETALNRAQRRGISLAEALLSVAENSRRGYYATDTYRRQMNVDDLERFKREVWDPVIAGSNYAHGFTGNASAGVAARQYARGTPGFDLPAARGAHESYFLEGPFKHPLPTLPTLPPAGTNSFVDRWSGINSTMSTTNNNSAHIENMTINSNAHDVVGIAKDIGGALDTHAFASGANNGPQ